MSLVRVGITATRTPLVPPQSRQLGLSLAEARRNGAEYLHHGDCVGGDAMAHDIALPLGYKLVIHPPMFEDFRAWRDDGAEILEQKRYWARNRDIVEAVDLLIGCPKAGTSLADWRKSGTWYTIRYAQEMNVPVQIIYPDGRAMGRIAA